MKYKIILVPFPFDDFSAHKVRPAICLTDPIGKYNHIVIAFITSQVPSGLNKTDIVVEEGTKYFNKTGLKITSTIRIHRLVTVPVGLIKRELGKAPTELQKEIKQRLQELFDLKK